MKIFTDHLDREVKIKNFPPQRIISLVPSQTELLHDLEMGERVVGITKFCVHPPEWFEGKPKVGGTKTVNFEKIAELAPDLIIGNKEENDREQLEKLAEKYPVWVSDIKVFEDGLSLIMNFSSILDYPANKAWALQEKISREMGSLGIYLMSEKVPVLRAAYLIWRKPLMTAGGDTFINSMMQEAGFENVFENQNRYPEISEADLKNADPEIILLASEPYPFSEKHLEFFHEICPQAKVVVVDGEMFSWYGTRMLKAPEYFFRLRERLK